jgi:hypothetical protein
VTVTVTVTVVLSHRAALIEEPDLP